jgi:hypothetical protein
MSIAEQQKWEEQRRQRGGAEGLAQLLTDERRASDAERIAARAAFEASPEGAVQAAADELAVAGARLSPAQWEKVQRELGNDPIPAQPNEWHLPLHLRQRIQDERLAERLAARQTRENR